MTGSDRQKSLYKKALYQRELYIKKSFASKELPYQMIYGGTADFRPETAQKMYGGMYQGIMYRETAAQRGRKTVQPGGQEIVLRIWQAVHWM